MYNRLYNEFLKYLMIASFELNCDGRNTIYTENPLEYQWSIFISVIWWKIYNNIHTTQMTKIEIFSAVDYITLNAFDT